MILDDKARRIFAFSEPIDMRKSFDGILSIVESGFKQDPLSGDIFVFVNRSSNYLKCIFWDRTGYCLFAKRLERGRFRISHDGGTQEISEKIFRLILDGIPLGRRH